MTTNFSKKEAIQFGWETTKNNLGFLVGLMFAWFLISTVFNIVSQKVMEMNSLFGIIFDTIFIVLSGIVTMGFIKISLKFCDKEKPKFSDLFSQYHLFFKFLFATFFYNLIIFVLIGVPIILSILSIFGAIYLFNKTIYTLIILGVSLLLITVGIILGIRFSLYTYFIIDKKSGPIESLKKSFSITKKAVWDLFVFFLMIIGINLLGVLFLLIGLFVTIPTTLIAQAFVYRQLLAQTENTNVNITTTQEQINSEQS